MYRQFSHIETPAIFLKGLIEPIVYYNEFNGELAALGRIKRQRLNRKSKKQQRASQKKGQFSNQGQIDLNQHKEYKTIGIYQLRTFSPNEMNAQSYNLPMITKNMLVVDFVPLFGNMFAIWTQKKQSSDKDGQIQQQVIIISLENTNNNDSKTSQIISMKPTLINDNEINENDFTCLKRKISYLESLHAIKMVWQFRGNHGIFLNLMNTNIKPHVIYRVSYLQLNSQLKQHPIFQQFKTQNIFQNVWTYCSACINKFSNCLILDPVKLGASLKQPKQGQQTGDQISRLKPILLRYHQMHQLPQHMRMNPTPFLQFTLFSMNEQKAIFPQVNKAKNVTVTNYKKGTDNGKSKNLFEQQVSQQEEDSDQEDVKQSQILVSISQDASDTTNNEIVLVVHTVHCKKQRIVRVLLNFQTLQAAAMNFSQFQLTSNLNVVLFSCAFKSYFIAFVSQCEYICEHKLHQKSPQNKQIKITHQHAIKQKQKIGVQCLQVGYRQQQYNNYIQVYALNNKSNKYEFINNFHLPQHQSYKQRCLSSFYNFQQIGHYNSSFGCLGFHLWWDHGQRFRILIQGALFPSVQKSNKQSTVTLIDLCGKKLLYIIMLEQLYSNTQNRASSELQKNQSLKSTQVKNKKSMQDEGKYSNQQGYNQQIQKHKVKEEESLMVKSSEYSAFAEIIAKHMIEML